MLNLLNLDVLGNGLSNQIESPVRQPNVTRASPPLRRPVTGGGSCGVLPKIGTFHLRVPSRVRSGTIVFKARWSCPSSGQQALELLVLITQLPLPQLAHPRLSKHFLPAVEGRLADYPSLQETSSIGVPASAWRRANTICSGVSRLFPPGRPPGPSGVYARTETLPRKREPWWTCSWSEDPTGSSSLTGVHSWWRGPA